MRISNQPAVTLSHEQEQAVAMMESGRNVFLTGGAGTGKSLVLNSFLYNTKKRCAVLGASGVSAVNLNGSTVHSFFRFGIEVQQLDAPFIISDAQVETYRSFDSIIIDEIGCLRADIFQAIDTVLRRACNPILPFGGKQLIVLGDFGQLEPVIPDQAIYQFLVQTFNGIYSFNTSAWKNAQFHTIDLQHVYRQTNKRDSKLLNGIRNGNYIEESEYPMDQERWIKGPPQHYVYVQESYIDEINKICYHPDQPLDPGSVTLTTTRKMAEDINRKALEILPGTSSVVQAKIYGHFPENIYPTSSRLIIKIGMRVIMLRNQFSAEGGLVFANGSTGTVVAFRDDVEPIVTIRLENGTEVEVKNNTWEHRDYDYSVGLNGEPVFEEKVVGWFQQLPIIQNSAMTIHKAQSLTIENLNIALGSRCFSNGQLYSALSRCRDLSQVRINRPICEEDVMVSPEVARFYHWNSSPVY